MARRARRTTTIGVAALAVAALLTGCEAVPPPATFTVTTTVDGLDAAPGDGVCEVTSGAGDCSLRAAFAEAAAAGRAAIVAPSGTYVLTVTDPDDGHADLDVTGQVDLRPIGAVADRIQLRGTGTTVDVAATGTLTAERVSFAGDSGPVVRVDGTAFLDRAKVDGGDPAISVGPDGALALGTSSVTGSASSFGVALANEGTAVVLFSTLVGSQRAAVHTAPGARTIVGATKASVGVFYRGAWFELQALADTGIVIDACTGEGLDSLGHNRVPDDTCSLGDPTDHQTFLSTWVDQVPAGVLGCGTTFTGDLGGVFGNPRPRPSDGDGDGVAACDIGYDEGAVPVALPTDLLPAGTEGVCYQRTLMGPVAQVIGWSATGLPPGLELAGGTVRGIPTAAGTYDVTVVLRSVTAGGQITLPMTILPPTGPPADSCP